MLNSYFVTPLKEIDIIFIVISSIFIVISSFAILVFSIQLFFPIIPRCFLWIGKKLKSISYKKREEFKKRKINAMFKNCTFKKDGKWVTFDWETDKQ